MFDGTTGKLIKNSPSIIGATNGGTGQNTTEVGSILNGVGTNSWGRLFGNTINSPKALTSTGTGTAANPLVWGPIVTAVYGTTNEIGISYSSTDGSAIFALPTALTFIGKTVTGGTINATAFNGPLGVTTPSSIVASSVLVGASAPASGVAINVSTGIQVRSTNGQALFQGSQTTENGARFFVRADGQVSWGDGTAVTDTNLYRYSSGTLKTDSAFVAPSVNGGAGVFTGLKLTTSPNNGYVLTSDALGNGAWTSPVAGMNYKGAWNASTNTPTLADGTGTNGDTYAVSTGGTQFTRTFVTGGFAIYNGSIWQPVGTSAAVTSVNSLTGVIQINPSIAGNVLSVTGGTATANLGAISTSGNAGTATALATGRTIAATGDVAYTSPSFDGSGNVTAAATLATVNSNVGSFGSATQAGTLTVNGKGLVTAAGNITVTPAVGSITGLGTGIATALATNVGSVGAPVVNGGALGTPSSGTVTNLTGTASININGTVGGTTPSTGAFTTLSATSSVSGVQGVFTGPVTSAGATVTQVSGKAQLSADTTYGGQLGGYGSTYDVTLLDRNNTLRLGVTTAGVSVTGVVSATAGFKLPTGTVASFGSAATAGMGTMVYATDLTLTAITGLGLTAVGGGANKAAMISDGTNWIIQ